MKEVTIYTDGACEPNPGTGGWGALLIYGGRQKGLHGGQLETTNNRMEMTAAIKALEAVRESCRITLFSDSQILINGMTKSRAKRAKREKIGKLPNADLWKLIDAESAKHAVEWCWIRGHDGNEGNEEADRLANLGLAGMTLH